MSLFGRATYVPETGWEDFSNDEPAQEEPVDLREDEWVEIALHAVKVGGRYDYTAEGLKISYRRVTKFFRPGDENDAWEFIGGSAA